MIKLSDILKEVEHPPVAVLEFYKLQLAEILKQYIFVLKTQFPPSKQHKFVEPVQRLHASILEPGFKSAVETFKSMKKGTADKVLQYVKINGSYGAKKVLQHIYRLSKKGLLDIRRNP